MKAITFGIDIDEVLRALVPSMVGLYNRIFGDCMTVNDVTDFMVDLSFPLIRKETGESASKWFFQDHGKELFAGSPEIEGAREALQILRKYGKVIIISYQKSIENKVDTLQWLSEHNMEYDGICFVKDKTIIHTDYLVDDNDWNFIGSNAKCGILVNAPYNMDIDIRELRCKSNCEEMWRVNNLMEFAKLYDGGKIYDQSMPPIPEVV